MDVQVKKWGNSIGLRIPYQIAEQLGIEEDSIVKLTATEAGLSIKKKSLPSTLDEIIASIPDNFEYPNDVADFVDYALVDNDRSSSP